MKITREYLKSVIKEELDQPEIEEGFFGNLFGKKNAQAQQPQAQAQQPQAQEGKLKIIKWGAASTGNGIATLYLDYNGTKGSIEFAKDGSVSNWGMPANLKNAKDLYRQATQAFTMKQNIASGKGVYEQNTSIDVSLKENTMKITREYLKRVIKEELGRIQEFDIKGIARKGIYEALDDMENKRRGNGDLKTTVEVTLDDGRGRTIEPGLYKVKRSWGDPDTHWGIYVWSEYDSHLGDISVKQVEELIGKRQAEAHAPIR